MDHPVVTKMFACAFALVTLLSLGSAALQQDLGTTSTLVTKLLALSADSGNDAPRILSSLLSMLKPNVVSDDNAQVGLWKKSLEDYRKPVGHDLLLKETQLREGSACNDLLRDGYLTGKAVFKSTILALDTIMMTLSYMNDAAKCEGMDESTDTYKCLKKAVLNASGLYSNAGNEGQEIVELVKKLYQVIPEDYKKCVTTS